MTLQHQKMRRRLCAVARAGAAASALAFVGLAMELPARLAPAQAAGANAGDAQVTNPTTGVALTSGTKDTDFTLKLPTNAACTGDSANDGYRVQSYHVPSSVDPSTLTFDANGPVPNGTGASFRQPLYQTNTSPYLEAQTAPANPAPGPGQVINIPAFDFSQYDASLLPAGTYNVGIACTKGGPSTTQQDKFWNVQFTIADDLSWTATQAAVTTTTPTTAGGGGATSSSSTTPTTAGSGGTTTTSTTRPSTTTTLGSGATSTSTTAASTTATTTGSSVSSGGLARAGSEDLPLALAGFCLLVFGRMAYLLGRPAMKGAHGK